MYWVLVHQEVRERRNQLRHPAYQKPELLATGRNQVGSWDITKLLVTHEELGVLSRRHRSDGALTKMAGGGAGREWPS
jgi:hypothetical protein